MPRNNSNPLKKRYYRNNYYRNMPNLYKVGKQVYNFDNNKTIKNNKRKNKNNITSTPAHQQKIYDIVDESEKNENAKKQYKKEKAEKEENNEKISQRKRIWPYLMTFVAGIYSINFFIEEY